jgi:O-antigen/teichoic acid export membrane protein
MFNNLNELKEIFRSKVIIFILSRYIGYFMLFINALFIARNLGVYFFGIYSFILLIIQYLNYANLGISYSLNYYLSVESSPNKKNNAIQDSLTLNLLISLIVIILFVLLYIFDFKFNNLNISKFYIPIALIAIIQLFIQIYISICRTYGITKPIIFNQLVIPALQLPGFLFCKNEDLLHYILITSFLGNLVSLIYFHFSYPIRFKYKFQAKNYNKLIIHGLNLLLYNVSYSLILTLGVTLVGIYFSIEDLAQYSFAATLSAACLMILGSVAYLFYSKILNKLTTIKIKSEMAKFVNKLSKIYFESSLFLILLIFNFTPVLYYFLPEYQPSKLIFKLLLIAYLIMTCTFGYNTLLVQTKKHIFLTKTALISIFSNGILSFFFIFFNLPFYFLALSTILSSLLFVVVISNRAMADFKSENGMLEILFSNKYGLLILCFFTFYDNIFLTFTITLLYFLIRKNTLIEIITYSINTIKRKDVFHLD